MQHVNLYQERFRTRRDVLCARNLGLVLVALVVALAGWTGRLRSGIEPVDARVAELIERRQVVERSLNESRERLEQARARAGDDGRIAALRSELDAKQRVLRLLESGPLAGGGGFSSYLEGLAEHVVDRLWLSAIRIDRGGEALRLAGHALEPERVPALVAALRDVEAYRGHEFRTVELVRSDDDPARVDFVLASDAGEGRER